MLTALAFSLWPLGRAARIPGGALFRDALMPERTRPSLPLLRQYRRRGRAGRAHHATSADRGFALWFCAAALGTLVLFRIGALRDAGPPCARCRSAPPCPRWARAREPPPTRRDHAADAGLGGSGLSTLAAVALIEGNVQREILQQLPANAPSFFFVDIQNDQLRRFESSGAGAAGRRSAAPGAQPARPHRGGERGAGGPVAATPETRWALQGDRGLTYAAMPPEGTRLVAGKRGRRSTRPAARVVRRQPARGWGVGLGDTIRVNVLGRDIDLRIASLRDIAWQSLSINFTLVASPGLLQHAPHAHIATVRIDPQQASLLRAVTDALPNVTGIRVEDVLAAIAALLGQVAAALAVTGSLTLIAGALVLVGAVAAGQRRRTQEAVILKHLARPAARSALGGWSSSAYWASPPK